MQPSDGDEWVERRLRELSLRQQVAQMLVVPLDPRGEPAAHAFGFPTVAHVRQWVHEVGTGGVQVVGGSADEVSRALDTLRVGASLPLLTVADLGEDAGGGRTRTAEGSVTHRSSALPDPQEAEHAGRLAAREARAVGARLGMVAAPRIHHQEASALPLQEAVRKGEALSAYLGGVRDEGVLAALELFAVADDARDPPLFLRWDLARLDALEVPAIRRAMETGLDAVLLAPVVVPALTGDTVPLPLSDAAISGWLRRDLGWEGPVIADLQALAHGGDTGERAVAAVAAGVDVLLGVTDAPAVIAAITHAVEAGRIRRTRVEAAARRVLALKERIRSLSPAALPDSLVPEAAAVLEVQRHPGMGVEEIDPFPARTLRRVSAADAGMSQTALDRVDATIVRAIEAGLFPGAALAVGRRGGLVRLRGYGRVGREPDAAEVNAEETLYDLASLTKVVGTTAVVMALVEAGGIELDAPVHSYVPEWRSAPPTERFAADGKESVTVRHLLAHTSGLPAGLNLYGRAASPEDALRQVFESRLVLRPGEVALYSDLGMILLAEVVRRAAGEPVDRILAWRVFAPLGMSSTMYLPPLAFWPQTAPSALTSERDFVLRGVVHDGNAFRLGGVAGHAGLFSTARDLAVFAQMLLNRGAYGEVRLFAPATVTAFTTSQPGAGERALGWDTPGPESSAGSYFSARSFGHTGYTGTSLWIDPTRDLFVVLLTNRTYDRTTTRQMLEIRREIHDGISLAITDVPPVRRPGAIGRITPPRALPPVPAPQRIPPPRSPRARRP